MSSIIYMYLLRNYETIIERNMEIESSWQLVTTTNALLCLGMCFRYMHQ